MRVGPAGHAGEPHTIADDVAEFAVGKVLGLRRTQVRNFGIEVAADCGLTGTVGAVADCAAIQEKMSAEKENIKSCSKLAFLIVLGPLKKLKQVFS